MTEGLWRTHLSARGGKSRHTTRHDTVETHTHSAWRPATVARHGVRGGVARSTSATPATPAARYPNAVVVAQRSTIGRVHMLEVACPLARHSHVVGVTEPATTLWCSFGSGFYTVTVDGNQP